ncbi:MAG: flagellar hook-basal body protein [Lachnospiraceae bacterium]|nr:flagellar hook-basal body protein [Lachnospiraceae bacterium]
MVKGLYTAFTGMVNEERRLDVLANNLANASTVGYKKEGATSKAFADMLAYRIKDITTPTHVGGIGTVNLGVKIGETYTNYEQGSFQVTDQKSNVAISGNGFFAIAFTNKAGETSIKYTRDGAFSVDNQGYFRTVDGDYVLNMNGALNSNMNAYVQIDPTQDYSIDSQGNITQNGQVVAQLGYIDFADYNFLSKYGENMYELVDGGQIIASNAAIEQGALEMSNVNVVDEMVNMITIQRAYEAGQKVIQTEDSTLEKAVTEVGRV